MKRRTHPGKIMRRARELVRQLRDAKSDHPWTNEELDLLRQLCELLGVKDED